VVVRRLLPAVFLGGLSIINQGITIISVLQSNDQRAVTMEITCSNHLGVKPTTLVTSCADANTKLEHLNWKDWGDATAYATGTLAYNDCTPTCVAGTWKSEPVTVWVWRLEGTHYTRLAASDTSRVPTTDLAPYPS